MTEPRVVSRQALNGLKVGLSVSDSADLARLGLTTSHYDVAVAELTRAILIAGGNIIYGGRLRPEGYTQIMMDEVRRYADRPNALTICLAEPEHRKFSDAELEDVFQRLGDSARLVCLDSNGDEVSRHDRAVAEPDQSPARSFTALRRYITGISHARVILGGRLRGYSGIMPGVMEEALFSVRGGQPLYVAGGFGGAAAALARALRYDDFNWAPADFPADIEEAAPSLEMVVAARREIAPVPHGLDPGSRQELATTHRPADVARIVVLGLARHFGGAEEPPAQ